MIGNQKKQLNKRFYPTKVYQGHPTRPPYTLYSLGDYKTFLSVQNELDELLEQWPCEWQRSVALLAVQEAFFQAGAVHWAEEATQAEDLINADGKALYYRRLMRRRNPDMLARYEHHLTLAQAAVVEQKRRKQGACTGKVPRHAPQRSKAKRVLISRSV